MHTIKKANLEDLDSILRVLDSVFLKGSPKKDKGFLTLNPGKEYYADLIQKTDYFYIALDNQQVVGFLAAYPEFMLDSEDEIQKYITENFGKKKFCYIFQVAVNPSHQANGIGRKMYKKLFKDTNDLKKMVATSAVPYNRASEKFHLRLGFEKIRKISRKDGGESFIYENVKSDIY